MLHASSAGAGAGAGAGLSTPGSRGGGGEGGSAAKERYAVKTARPEPSANTAALLSQLGGGAQEGSSLIAADDGTAASAR